MISVNCIPANVVQSTKVRKVLEVVGPRVGGGECTASVVLVHPTRSFSQVRFQVDDRSLTASILQFGMVAHGDHVEHDGSWTEVEGHAVAHVQTLVASQRLRKPAPLDAADSDSSPGSLTPGHCRIRPQAAVSHNRGQPVDVDDVVYLRLCWNKHDQASLRCRVAADSLSIVSHSTAPSGGPAAALLMGRSMRGLSTLR